MNMDPKINLGPNEVVQMEGWLMKRKAGFDELEAAEEGEFEDDSVFKAMPAQIAPSGNKLEALLLGKTERKRYFVLSTDKGDGNSAAKVMLTYCSRKPVFARAEEGGAHYQHRPLDLASQHLRGLIWLDETSDISLRNGQLIIVVPGKSIHVRPAIRSDTESVVQATEWFMALKRAIRDLYVLNRHRSSKQGADGALARAKSAGGKGIRFEMPESMGEVMSDPMHRKQFRNFCEFSQAAENLDFYEKIEEYQDKFAAVTGATAGRKTLVKRVSDGIKRLSGSGGSGSMAAAGGNKARAPKDLVILGKDIVAAHVREDSPKQVNLADQNRKAILDQISEQGNRAFTADLFDAAKDEILTLMESNFFIKFLMEQERKTGAFSSLYGKHGRKGYEIVLGHFANVRTDLGRIMALYQMRLDQVDQQLQVLRQALRISTEPAVPALESNRDMLVHFFRGAAVMVQTFNEFRTQLSDHVLFALKWSLTSINFQLENVIQNVTSKVEELEAAKSTLAQTKAKVGELEVLLREKEHEADEFPSERAREVMGRHAVADPDAIAPALKDAKEQIPIWEMHIVRGTKGLDDIIVEKLDKLEALELNRLGAQQKAIRHAAQAEKNFFSTLNQDQSKFHAIIARAHPAKDLTNFLAGFEAKLTTAQEALEAKGEI